MTTESKQVYVVTSWKIVDKHAHFIRVVGVYSDFNHASHIMDTIRNMSTKDKIYYAGMTVTELDSTDAYPTSEKN